MTVNAPAFGQEHEGGNCFWDSQSEKALCKQEGAITVVLSGVIHFHNDLPKRFRENVMCYLFCSGENHLSFKDCETVSSQFSSGSYSIKYWECVKM